MCSKEKRLIACFRRYGVLALTVLATGCAGTHLYNAGEHELAQMANTTFKEVGRTAVYPTVLLPSPVATCGP